MSFRIRAIEPGDASALAALRREALSSSPWAFSASVDDDVGLSPSFARSALADGTGSAVLGAFEGERLVGMIGVYRPEKKKWQHRAVIWGMFVTPEARGVGCGAALLDAAIQRARSWPGVLQVHLSVTDTAEKARRLYERAGFRRWGSEPRALGWRGRFVDEHHFVLELE